MISWLAFTKRTDLKSLKPLKVSLRPFNFGSEKRLIKHFFFIRDWNSHFLETFLVLFWQRRNFCVRCNDAFMRHLRGSQAIKTPLPGAATSSQLNMWPNDITPWTQFFPIHRTYFCVCHTDGAARIYFSSLYLSENMSPYGQGLFLCMSEKER